MEVDGQTLLGTDTEDKEGWGHWQTDGDGDKQWISRDRAGNEDWINTQEEERYLKSKDHA